MEDSNKNLELFHEVQVTLRETKEGDQIRNESSPCYYGLSEFQRLQ